MLRLTCSVMIFAAAAFVIPAAHAQENASDATVTPRLELNIPDQTIGPLIMPDSEEARNTQEAEAASPIMPEDAGQDKPRLEDKRQGMVQVEARIELLRKTKDLLINQIAEVLGEYGNHRSASGNMDFDDLGSLIEKAISSDPNIVIAESRLRTAEAELRAARQRIAHEVAALCDKRREALRALQNMLEQIEKNIPPLSEAVQQELTQRIRESGARLSEIMTRLRSLTEAEPGAPPAPQPSFADLESRHFAKRPTQGGSGLPTAVEKMLESPVSIRFEDSPLAHVMEFLTEWCGIPLVPDKAVAPVPITVSVNDITVAQLLQALSDHSPELCFVIRDYGVMATTRERAMTINAPTIPDDVPLLLPAYEEEKKLQE